MLISQLNSVHYDSDPRRIKRTDIGYIYEGANYFVSHPLTGKHYSKNMKYADWKEYLSVLPLIDDQCAEIMKIIIDRGPIIWDLRTNEKIKFLEVCTNPTIVIYQDPIADEYITCLCTRDSYAMKDRRYYDLARCERLSLKDGRVYRDSRHPLYRTFNDRVKEYRITFNVAGQWQNIVLNHALKMISMLMFYNIDDAIDSVKCERYYLA